MGSFVWLLVPGFALTLTRREDTRAAELDSSGGLRFEESPQPRVYTIFDYNGGFGQEARHSMTPDQYRLLQLDSVLSDFLPTNVRNVLTRNFHGLTPMSHVVDGPCPDGGVPLPELYGPKGAPPVAAWEFSLPIPADPRDPQHGSTTLRSYGVYPANLVPEDRHVYEETLAQRIDRLDLAAALQPGDIFFVLEDHWVDEAITSTTRGVNMNGHIPFLPIDSQFSHTGLVEREGATAAQVTVIESTPAIEGETGGTGRRSLADALGTCHKVLVLRPRYRGAGATAVQTVQALVGYSYNKAAALSVPFTGDHPHTAAQVLHALLGGPRWDLPQALGGSRRDMICTSVVATALQAAGLAKTSIGSYGFSPCTLVSMLLDAKDPMREQFFAHDDGAVAEVVLLAQTNVPDS
jgi:hypothetical protein